MSKCVICNGTGRVGSLFLGKPCTSCGGTGFVTIKGPTKTKTKTKIDGLMIKCGTKSLWVSKEAVEDMFNGKTSGVGRLESLGIWVVPNEVKIE